MAIISFFILLLAVPFTSSKFLTPVEASVLQVGDVQDVQYKTTFKAYTIALWQQSPNGGSAVMGPVIYETTNGRQSEFGWLVQTYDLPLDVSNQYYLWLFEGDASAQGNQSTHNRFWSGYFNITKKKSKSSIKGGDPASTKTAFFSASVTVSTSPRSSKPGTTQAHPSNKEESKAVPTRTDSDANTLAGGLTASAKAGIGSGIGIAITILAAGICGLLFLKYRHRKKQELLALQTTQTNRCARKTDPVWEPTPMPPQIYPAELSGPRLEPVELSGTSVAQYLQ